MVSTLDLYSELPGFEFVSGDGYSDPDSVLLSLVVPEKCQDSILSSGPLLPYRFSFTGYLILDATYI